MISSIKKLIDTPPCTATRPDEPVLSARQIDPDDPFQIVVSVGDLERRLHLRDRWPSSGRVLPEPAVFTEA